MVAGSNTITNKYIANGAITEDKLATDLKNTIKNRGFHLVEKCNLMNLGRPNSHGLLCAAFRVTNAAACLNAKKDNVHSGNHTSRTVCRNGNLYYRGCHKSRH